MTVEETRKLLKIIQSTYPRFMDGRDPEITLKTWAFIFSDVSWELAQSAMMLYISQDTRGFPPMPGNIRALIHARQEAAYPSEVEAWALVSHALEDGYYHSREEFSKLPDVVQRTLGNPDVLRDWSNMDEEQVQTVIASNFQRSYRARLESIRRDGMLPAHIMNKLPAPEIKEPTPLIAAPAAEPEQERTQMPTAAREIFAALLEKYKGG